jgi:hypothetical protein
MVVYLAVLPAASPAMSINSRASLKAAASLPLVHSVSARTGSRPRHPLALRLRGGGAPAGHENSKGAYIKKKEVVLQTDDERVEEIGRLLEETKLSLDDLQYLLKYHGMCVLSHYFHRLFLCRQTI